MEELEFKFFGGSTATRLEPTLQTINLKHNTHKAYEKYKGGRTLHFSMHTTCCLLGKQIHLVAHCMHTAIAGKDTLKENI